MPTMKRLFFVVGFGLACAGCLPPAQARSEQKAMIAASFVPDAAQAILLSKARSAGATDLETAAGPGGGMIVNGRLAGRPFVLAIPARWNGEAVLFGQGYATPGSTPGVPTDPIAKDPGGGTLEYIYREGLAVGIAAFDKSGIATESGAKNTLRLHDLVVELGATRQYVVGGSMGGSIVMSLIELYPGAFTGAVSMCGVTEGWLPLIEQLSDMRAAYNVLTDGTPYALPGEHDVTRSALPTVPTAGDPTPGDAFREQQKMKILMPVFALFSAAKANPGGKEARIVRQVAAIGGFAPDPAAFGAPLYSAALGMDDIAATMGGQPVGNIGKFYAPPDMSAEEAADFNRRIQRFAADPKAVVYAGQWHEATGKFRVPLVTVHQTLDALVPFSQSDGLGRIVKNVGNAANLVQYEVPPTRFALPGGMDGYTHCGFSAEQNIAAFEAMRNWVRTGKKPGPDAVK
jgi:pimeloyl-ACP methyl ester carboxylesterase